MHQALYRKYRSTDFDDVCGQEHITSVLKYESANDKISHAYLFCGSRGTGKTSCAKILAKAINCDNVINGNPCGECEPCKAINSGYATDVLEMDAASNNGVEYIRDIRDEVAYTPAMLKKRVYIIDEVHMLSANAFNALLKTLEEPPEHVVFILATTELHKLPATIISRCQRFDFRRISVSVIADRLQYIAGCESIKVTREASELIAKMAQGGMRDAISLFELCSGSRDYEVNTEVVTDILGISGYDSVSRVANAVAEKKYNVIFDEISEIISSSKDITVFWQDLCAFYRDMLVVKSAPDPKNYLELTEPEYDLLVPIAEKFSFEALLYHSRLIDDALYNMQKSPQNKRLCAEMTLVRMCNEKLDSSNEALNARISALEDKITILSSREIDAAAIVQNTASDNSDSHIKKDSIKSEPANGVKKIKSEPAKSADSQIKPIKQLDCWNDVIERLSEIDKGIQSFLIDSTAYTNAMQNDGKITIRVTNNFASAIMEQDKARQSVVTALKLSGFPISSSDDISVEQIEKTKKTANLFDEIFE